MSDATPQPVEPRRRADRRPPSMSLVLFVVVTVAFDGPRPRPPRPGPSLSTGVGLVGLGGRGRGGRIAIVPDQVVVIGGGALATTRLPDGSSSSSARSSGSALAVSGLAGGSRRDAPAVTLGILAPRGLTLGLLDPRAAVLVATAGGLFGVLVTLVPSGGRAGATVGIRESARSPWPGALAIAATAWFGRDLSGLTAQPVVFGLAYLAFAVAVALRFGAIPFHLWAARLADVVPETALPILTALRAGVARPRGPRLDRRIGRRRSPTDLGTDRLIVVAIAVASIVLAGGRGVRPGRHRARPRLLDRRRRRRRHPGARRARPRRVGTRPDRGSSPSSSPAARSPRGSPGSAPGSGPGRVADLRGWALRSPLLTVAFGLIVIASVGFPGLGGVRCPDRDRELALSGPARHGRAHRHARADRLLRAPAGRSGCSAARSRPRAGRRLATASSPGSTSPPSAVAAPRPGTSTARSPRGAIAFAARRSSRWPRPAGHSARPPRGPALAGEPAVPGGRPGRDPQVRAPRPRQRRRRRPRAPSRRASEGPSSAPVPDPLQCRWSLSRSARAPSGRCRARSRAARPG